ncbi:lipopolysaccharide transport periplasmic protein LptA [Bordetella genomosp. 10]|uniref:Lipopolysaccharide export system protein LptA n=1 Tax=Bordetella genomosp. 10 TaxID=1416804 RepID=A0A261SJ66_9BORD|nr:lipopolysaccharide transport periplasmic protein LptA [Bordetella genomosp. 10]OZI37037.1 lipopolysaccharide transport periplasmic protein LptA [Bordetella genomosp. 10]
MTQIRPFSFSALLFGVLLAGAAGSVAAQQGPANAAPKSGQGSAAPAKSSTGKAATPEEEPNTQILSDTLHYDDVKKTSVFTGNVIMTRGLLTMKSDKLELHEDAQGGQFGVATMNNTSRMVNIRQERPENFELIEGVGLRAEYDGPKSQFDLIGQAVVTRYICGKQFDTIRGQRVRYNDKAGTYEAIGGPGSSAPGGRVRSIVEPRARTDAAIEECRRAQAAKAPLPSPPPAKTTR